MFVVRLRFPGENRRLPGGVALAVRTLPGAQRELLAEVLDTVRYLKAYEEPVRRAVLEAQCSVAELGEVVVANRIEHWIEEIDDA